MHEGLYIGKINTYAHQVSGHVYAIDEYTILIKNFFYDGLGQDTFFWAGSSVRPSNVGFIVPDEEGNDWRKSRTWLHPTVRFFFSPHVADEMRSFAMRLLCSYVCSAHCSVLQDDDVFSNEKGRRLGDVFVQTACWSGLDSQLNFFERKVNQRNWLNRLHAYRLKTYAHQATRGADTSPQNFTLMFECRYSTSLSDNATDGSLTHLSRNWMTPSLGSSNVNLSSPPQFSKTAITSILVLASSVRSYMTRKSSIRKTDPQKKVMSAVTLHFRRCLIGSSTPSTDCVLTFDILWNDLHVSRCVLFRHCAGVPTFYTWFQLTSERTVKINFGRKDAADNCFGFSTGQKKERPSPWGPFRIRDKSVDNFIARIGPSGGWKGYAGITGKRLRFIAGRLCAWKYNTSEPRQADEFISFPKFRNSLRLQCDDGQPAILSWMPNESTPDVVYYQSYTTPNLGWKIVVVDEIVTGNSRATPATTATSMLLALCFTLLCLLRED
ncbi:unnamed protein product [Ixodes persulcatus]